MNQINRAPSRGFFIAIEGLDGAGKTTLAQNLCALLKARGYDPLYIKEPTDGQWGQKIRQIAQKGRQGISPQEEMSYFVKDRAEDVAKNIAPAIAAQRPVIADRYIASNVAYQATLGLSTEEILAANQNFPWPDLTFYLQCPVAEGLRRIEMGRPGGTNLGFETESYLAGVQKIFDQLQVPGFLPINGLDAPGALLRQVTAQLEAQGFLEKLEIIDTHCHLSLDDFKNDLAEVFERAESFGLKYYLDVGLEEQSNLAVMANAQKFPKVYAAVGWHPHDAKTFSLEKIPVLEKQCADKKVLAVGEIGLDYYRNNSPREKQLFAFNEMLELAARVKLPVVIHCREAFAETYEILKKFHKKLAGGVIHCFTGTWAEAEEFLNLGFYISLPGVITFPKGENLREVAAKCPADRLLVETDAPFLAPIPFRGKRNEPAHLVYHLRAIADARQISVAAAGQLTLQNALRLFDFESAQG